MRFEPLFVKGAEISQHKGYKGNNMSRKPHTKDVACDFLMVLTQRLTVWALQLLVPKDTSGNPAYSTTSPHSLKGQHAWHQPQADLRPSLKNRVLGSVRPVCSLPSLPRYSRNYIVGTCIPYSPTNSPAEQTSVCPGESSGSGAFQGLQMI